MLYDKILIRFGDLTLKGKNKKVFVTRLNQTIKYKLEKYDCTLDYRHDCLYVNLKNSDYNNIVEELKLIPGIRNFSLVVSCSNDLEEIKNNALMLVREQVTYDSTFKVESKRSYKQYYLTSQEITKEVAAHVLKNTDNLTVDVKKPEKVLNVHLKSDCCLLYFDKINGLGGFPAGIAGKGLLMISGGIDSPVAGYLCSKQGVEVEALHFESTPMTSIESAQKVLDLIRVNSKYSRNDKMKLHFVHFSKIHQYILKVVPDSYNITIMRRIMYKIAHRLCKKLDIKVIINGESLGQVASQTLESMLCVNDVTNLPVIRPLATYDKNEIIAISRDIGAYDTSIKPFEDCCTVYVPKSPVTKPSLEKCLEIEKNSNFESLIDSAIEDITTVIVKRDEFTDLSLYGFELKSTLVDIRKEKKFF